MSMLEEWKDQLKNMEKEVVVQVTSAIVLVFAIAYLLMNHIEIITGPYHSFCDAVNA